MPVHCTALGKVLLANAGTETQASVLAAGLSRRAPRTITSPRVLSSQLTTIAETGIAFEYDESAIGIVCVAAPIADSDGAIVAAVSVTGPATRFTPANHRAAVRAAAAGISMTLSRRVQLRD